MDTTPIYLRRNAQPYEMVILWYDGQHCNFRTLRFWADPCAYREEALRQFLISFCISNANADTVRQQWFGGNGQIYVPLGNNLFRHYEIDYLGEVVPVVVCMDGSTVVAVTRAGEDVLYDIEQVR